MKYVLWLWKWNYKRFTDKTLPQDFYVGTTTHISYCAAAIAAGVRKQGVRALFSVNLVLFLCGALFMLADDYVLYYTSSWVVSGLAIAAAGLFLVMKFDAWKLNQVESLLKLLYIGLSCLVPGLYVIAYAMLIVFENILAYSMWGGF